MFLFRRRNKLTPKQRRRKRTIMVVLCFIAMASATVIFSRITGERDLQKLPDAAYRKLYGVPLTK